MPSQECSKRGRDNAWSALIGRRRERRLATDVDFCSASMVLHAFGGIGPGIWLLCGAMGLSGCAAKSHSSATRPAVDTKSDGTEKSSVAMGSDPAQPNRSTSAPKDGSKIAGDSGTSLPPPGTEDADASPSGRREGAPGTVDGGTVGGNSTGGTGGDGSTSACPVCDDRIDCTEDTCVNGMCSHSIAAGKCGSTQACKLESGGCVEAAACHENDDCADSDPCTTNERCNKAMAVCQYDVLDHDADKHAPASCGGDDPDDDDASMFPGAPDICDGIDNDGDGLPMRSRIRRRRVRATRVRRENVAGSARPTMRSS